MKRLISILLVVLLLAFSLVGCSKTISKTTTETTKKSSETVSAKEAETVMYEQKDTKALLNEEDIKAPGVEEVNEAYQEREPKAGDKIAILHTSYGDIYFRFLEEVAPLAVNNFIALAEAGRYDNTIFHRVINNFMIQGGDYTNYNGTGGVSAYGNEFNNEVSEFAKNITGAVAMANAGANTNGSQFYINQVDNNYLDGGYTVFGQVYEGMEVVEDIANVVTGMNDKPQTDVVLSSVEISEYAE